MSIYTKQKQGASRTKRSGNGKRRIKFEGKRRHERGNYFTATKLSEENKTRQVRHRGGKVTRVLKNAGFANLLIDNKYVTAKIMNVVESKDNRNFARLNIITKGTIIETEKGKAVVLNRPARDGSINARIIK